MIANVERGQLISAMERFDRELRSSEAWKGWENRENHKFAIDFQNRLYPVKQIISMASGSSVSEFSGGAEANGYIRTRGFGVRALREQESNTETIQKGLETILRRYVKSRTSEAFGGNELAATFRSLQDALANSQPVLRRPTVSVSWAMGKGNWAKIPWVAFLDSRETHTTQRGVYGVLLFRQDMSGTYQTFNQGVTEPRDRLGAVEGEKYLRSNAAKLRERSTSLLRHGFHLDDAIRLRADKGLGSRYEASTIAYKLYETANLPSGSAILDDLEALLEVYDQYMSSKGSQEAPEPNLLGSGNDLDAVRLNFATALRECYISFGKRHDEIAQAFIASLATKRFVILTGLSGSGKTQIALQFGRWLGADRYSIVPVRPDWTGAEAVFGYEDALQPLVEGRRAWHVPPSLRFMLKAARDPDNPYLLLLDEMNLAHVERYLADLLSGMESRDGCLQDLVPGEDGTWRARSNTSPALLPIPSNLFLVGTVNVDETTYMFSPKVLDRANTIEFRVETDELQPTVHQASSCRAGPPALVRRFLEIARDAEWQHEHPAPGLSVFTERMLLLHALLSEGGFEFGHRAFFEGIRFASMLSSAGNRSADDAMDYQVLQKVLPRLHGSRRRLEPTLCALSSFCIDLLFLPGSIADRNVKFDPESAVRATARLPRSFDKARRMTRNLRANQFTSFTE